MRPPRPRFAENKQIITQQPIPAAYRRKIMSWIQRSLQLPAFPRGFHLITHDVAAALPELGRCRVGLLNVYIQHTSASLSINENADPDVPADLETAISAIAPEDFPYRHTCEGPDDMPAHVKSSLLGSSLTIPVIGGSLCLGTWQGLYLCEHRRHGGRRRLVLTLWGEMEGDAA
jgi:secondary thiamine-phosphate synthase enzyme